MTPPTHRRRGAPLGNTNSFKHGYYSSRYKQRPLSAEEVTDLKSLFNEVALIRVFTSKLVESVSASANTEELTEIIRILCLSSAAIVRILRAHYLITGSDSALDPEIEHAIQQVQSRLASTGSSPARSSSPSGDSMVASSPNPSEI